MKRCALLVAASLLAGCVYDPYTGGYYPAAVAYPSYPYYAAPVYAGPPVAVGLAVGGGGCCWGWRGGGWGWHGGGWGGGWHGGGWHR